jgi:hypothetical protein
MSAVRGLRGSELRLAVVEQVDALQGADPRCDCSQAAHVQPDAEPLSGAVAHDPDCTLTTVVAGVGGA